MEIIFRDHNRTARVFHPVAMITTLGTAIVWTFWGFLSGRLLLWLTGENELVRSLAPKLGVNVTNGLVVLVCAAIAWRWRLIGGVILIILALVPCFVLYRVQELVFQDFKLMVWGFMMFFTFSLPLLVAGTLFFISWGAKKKGTSLS